MATDTVCGMSGSMYKRQQAALNTRACVTTFAPRTACTSFRQSPRITPAPRRRRLCRLRSTPARCIPRSARKARACPKCGMALEPRVSPARLRQRVDRIHLPHASGDRARTSRGTARSAAWRWSRAPSAWTQRKIPELDRHDPALLGQRRCWPLPVFVIAMVADLFPGMRCRWAVPSRDRAVARVRCWPRRWCCGAAGRSSQRGWQSARQPQPQHVHADRARRRAWPTSTASWPLLAPGLFPASFRDA